MKKLRPREDALLLEVSTHVGSSDLRQEFRLTLGVLTNVGSSNTTSDSTSNRPDNCSDLTFRIPIQTVPNSWESWKIRLGEVSY